MAKSVQVSSDNGTTWYTLPGSSGSFSVDGSALDDSVFGASYKSQFPGILSWKVEANAIYKGIAGYLATIKKGGTPTTLTAAATTLIATKTYQVTDAAKQVLDTATTVTVTDGSGDITSHVDSIDYLMGTVVINSSFTVTNPLTITGKYLPMTTLGKAKSWDLKQTADTIDTTDFATAQANGGYSTFGIGLRTITMSLKGFYDISSGFRATLAARTPLIIEINPDGAGKSLCRGFFTINSESQSGDLGALEEETTNFTLNVPSSSFTPFNWQHASTTTLHNSVKTLLTSWLAATNVKVKYLYDGTNGITGDAAITDVSLSGGLNAMNNFTVNLMGSGAVTAVGTG